MLVSAEDQISLLWIIPCSLALSNILLFFPVMFVMGTLMKGQTWHWGPTWYTTAGS